jgi:ribose 5-phosphate isomerase A
VDGADEVTPELDLIKGGGGAHTREKIVNGAAKLNVIIVDEGKLVTRLGEKYKVPLEVLPFGFRTTLGELAAFGRPEVRQANGQPYLSDSGNFIVDLATGPLAAPAELDRALHAVPGIVEPGLFIQRADVVVIAGRGGVSERVRAK